ncbi:MAG: DUF1501 domain-containing protein [Planctomycetaceae bacterium]|nr:DUF1501 domain-containing protein [Planctomycetaceae bacterium]
MLTFFGPERPCRRMSRRDVLQVGALGLGGLALPEILRRKASAEPTGAGQGSVDRARGKSVILIWLRGGASHIDSFDMKPAAPAEIRGEFSPIATRVPGIDVCEHLPLTAAMMDRLVILRGIRSNDLGDHTPHYIITGSPDRGRRPAFGSIVSYLRPRHDGLPPYVSLMYKPPGLYDNEAPLYTGPAHRPFVPRADGLANLSLAKGVSLDRLHDRRTLLKHFDGLQREADASGVFAGMDTFTERAVAMVTSPQARDAFDLKQESPDTHARYGKYCENFLMARRLVEAGVPVVTLKVGDWDTHERNFKDMRDQLPQLDRGFHALVSDLYDRGLDKDVTVVLWGEFGRAPRISRGDGRDHWPEAGAAVIAGGGFRTGQTIGETDAQGGRSKGTPYTPANVFASLYRHLGIDPSQTIPDHNRRPMPLLDDRRAVEELAGTA